MTVQRRGDIGDEEHSQAGFDGERFPNVCEALLDPQASAPHLRFYMPVQSTKAGSWPAIDPALDANQS